MLVVNFNAMLRAKTPMSDRQSSGTDGKQKVRYGMNAANTSLSNSVANAIQLSINRLKRTQT